MLLQAFNDVFEKRGTTEKYYDRYRTLALALLFGLYMLIAVVIALLAAIARTPRTTAGLTLVFWLLVGAVLVIGSGMI